jgi:DNA-binding PadR family transcriptional regulator
MKHRGRGGGGPPDDDPAGAHHHHHGHGHGRHHGRLFEYGELRLLLLAMIADRPRHGYELMKLIEERMGGSYSPSPGVIYPTLAWLDDMGYATLDSEQAARKRYCITPEGESFLLANRAAADELLARAAGAAGGADPVPAPIVRAMENLKLAMRLRLKRAVDEKASQDIAAVLDAAAKAVERS